MYRKPNQYLVLLAAMAIICLAAGIATAAPVTQSITYQGKLTSAAGSPLTGTYSVMFTLYDASTGGAVLSTDTHSVTATNGLFTTPIAATNPAVVNGQALWLGIKVGSDPEMTPRQEIRPVPYALSLVPATTTRTISFPANSLNYPSGSSIIRQDRDGLRWAWNYQEGAFLNIMRPDDWDGVSNVILSLYFYPVTDTAGNVIFFIRPRSFNPGDQVIDANSIVGTPAAVSGKSILKKQIFTIPASRLTKELWFITIQNDATGATYPDDVLVTSVGLTYTAKR